MVRYTRSEKIANVCKLLEDMVHENKKVKRERQDSRNRRSITEDIERKFLGWCWRAVLGWQLLKTLKKQSVQIRVG